jgi:hypothetical protein
MQSVAPSDTIFDFFGSTNTHAKRIGRSENKLFKYVLSLHVGGRVCCLARKLRELRDLARKEELDGAAELACGWRCVWLPMLYLGLACHPPVPGVPSQFHADCYVPLVEALCYKPEGRGLEPR